MTFDDCDARVLRAITWERQQFDRERAAIAREARAEALEEAARVCDELRGPIEIYNRGYPAMMEAAQRIRALRGEEERTIGPFDTAEDAIRALDGGGENRG